MNLDIKTIIVDNPIKVASNIRTKTSISDEEIKKVKAIFDTVVQNRDRALLDYTLNFDGVRLDSILVRSKEIDDAYKCTSKEQVRALKEIKRKIPLKKLGTFINLLSGINFVISNKYFNGKTLRLDGGL